MGGGQVWAGLSRGRQQVTSWTQQEGAFVFGPAAAQKHPPPTQTDRQTRQGPRMQGCSAGVTEWGPPCHHPCTARTQAAAPPGRLGRPSLWGSSSSHSVREPASPSWLEIGRCRASGSTVTAPRLALDKWGDKAGGQEGVHLWPSLDLGSGFVNK